MQMRESNKIYFTGAPFLVKGKTLQVGSQLQIMRECYDPYPGSTCLRCQHIYEFKAKVTNIDTWSREIEVSVSVEDNAKISPTPRVIKERDLKLQDFEIGE